MVRVFGMLGKYHGKKNGPAGIVDACSLGWVSLSAMLPHPNDKHLEAAQGWLELGNEVEAFREIEEIHPRFKTHPEVLKLQWGIHAKGKQWLLCVEVARFLSERMPTDPWGFLHYAIALRQLGRTKEAYEVLEPIIEDFPQEWQIGYFLACYSAQLGDIPAAEAFLEGAIDGGGDKVKLLALEEKDLEPIWPEVSEI